MGYGRCATCGKKDYRDELGWECCQTAANCGMEGDECELCSSNRPKTACGKCKREFCEEDGTGEKEKCCGLYLCGFADNEDYWSTCQYDHEVTTIEECGHVTCNYYKKKGCLTCKVKEAKELEES